MVSGKFDLARRLRRLQYSLVGKILKEFGLKRRPPEQTFRMETIICPKLRNAVFLNLYENDASGHCSTDCRENSLPHQWFEGDYQEILSRRYCISFEDGSFLVRTQGNSFKLNPFKSAFKRNMGVPSKFFHNCPLSSPADTKLTAHQALR